MLHMRYKKISIVNSRSRYSHKAYFRKYWSVPIVVVLCAMLSGCGLVSDADTKFYFGGTRQPNNVERLYIKLASEIHSIKPCYLIAPNSVTVGSFNSPGTRVTLVRSECFFVVANATGDLDICNYVRTASTLLYSGTMLDAEMCRRRAEHSALAFGLAYELDVHKTLQLAGYRDNEIDAYLVSQECFSSIVEATRFRRERPGSYWNEAARYMLHSREFFGRVGQLPGFGTKKDQEKMRTLRWEPPARQKSCILSKQQAQGVPKFRVPEEK